MTTVTFGDWSREHIPPVPDAIRICLPYSEVCSFMHVAGQHRWVRKVNDMSAQILNDDGSNFSFPITLGEAGMI